MILSVFVGGLEMAGPFKDMDKACDLITDSGLEIDEPVPVSDFLGRGQFQSDVAPEDVNMIMKGIRPTVFCLDAAQTMSTLQDLASRAIRYDMVSFHKQFAH